MIIGKGYRLEVDLHCPVGLHDKFKEFPPALEALTPDIEGLTPYQREIGANAGIIHNGLSHGTNIFCPASIRSTKLCHSLKDSEILRSSRGSGKEEAYSYIV